MLWSECKHGARARSVSVASHAYADYVQIIACLVILSKMVPGWCGGDELLNKVIILGGFLHTKNILVAS